MRSSWTSARNPPPLGLDDLLLRREELRDHMETLLLCWTRSFKIFIFVQADFQLAEVTMESSPTAKSQTRVAVARLPDSWTDTTLNEYSEQMSGCLLAPASAKRRRSAKVQTSAVCRLREQTSAATMQLRSRRDPEPNEDAGVRAGGSPQPHGVHAQDRVLRFFLQLLRHTLRGRARLMELAGASSFRTAASFHAHVHG